MDAVKNNKNILCFVDEVLRGTNTVERIAAASQILEQMAESGVFCFAATHDIELTSLRNSISYITQDNFLFSTTIKDNISLFRENFEDSEIEESTEKSMISGEIEKMKNGIYTIIGEELIPLLFIDWCICVLLVIISYYF